MTEYRLGADETVRVVHVSPDRLEVEATYGSTKLPPAHRHPTQVETFEVLGGRLRVVLGGVESTLGVGERVEVTSGAVHRMAAADAGGARVAWTTRPALRTQTLFAALDAAHRRHDGRPPRLLLLGLVLRHRDVFRLAFPMRAR